MELLRYTLVLKIWILVKVLQQQNTERDTNETSVDTLATCYVTQVHGSQM